MLQLARLQLGHNFTRPKRDAGFLLILTDGENCIFNLVGPREMHKVPPD